MLTAPLFLTRYKRLRLYERLPVYEMCWERRGVWGDCWGTAEVFPVSPLPVACWYLEWPACDWCLYSGEWGYFSNRRKLACIFTFPSQSHQHRILYDLIVIKECKIISHKRILKNSTKILKGYSTPKWKFCCFSLTPMSFRTRKSFVSLQNTI